MLTLKSKTQSDLTTLESAVTDATQKLVSARLTLDEQQKRLDAIEAARREDYNSDALQQEQSGAERELHETRISVRNYQNALRTAEHELDLARTMPLRKANATQLRKAADGGAKALPVASDALAAFVKVIDAAAFPDVEGAELLLSWVRSTAQALAGPDGAKFVQALRRYADGVESGERPAAIRPPSWPY